MLSSTNFCRKRIGLLLLFLLVGSVYSGAKDYSVTGRVTDTNGATVPNAKVSIRGANISTPLSERKECTCSSLLGLVWIVSRSTFYMVNGPTDATGFSAYSGSV